VAWGGQKRGLTLDMPGQTVGSPSLAEHTTVLGAELPLHHHGLSESAGPMSVPGTQ
jgi:hypothetical protein